MKVPYMIIVGEKEEANNSISLRYRDSGENVSLQIDDFIQMITKEVKKKN